MPMSRDHTEAPATYFRLTDETWAIIVEEYANGATAKQLGAKWKVAGTSIYRHVGAAKMTKRDCGDKRARAHAKAVTLAKKARDAKLGPREETVEPALTTLFVKTPDDRPEDGDPAALARLAILGSGRAMKGRLWSEARALSLLAETYGRLGGGTGGEGYRLADIVQAVFDAEFCTRLMTMHPDHDNPPEKQEYWQRLAARKEENGIAVAQVKSLGYREGRADLRAELGLEPEPEGPDAYHHLGAGMVRKGAKEVDPDGGYGLG